MGSGTLFNGDSIKLLKEKMKFKGGTQLLNVSGIPADTATDGSYAFSDNGKNYKRAAGVWVEDNSFTDAEKALIANAILDGGNGAAITIGTTTDSLITFIRNNVAIAWIGTALQGWLFALKTVHQGGIDADNKLVENVPTPTADDHAVNKAFVDNSIQPLLDINTDTKEPSGFIDGDYDHHGVIEYTLDGTTVFQINNTGVYSENSTGLWHDGVSAVAGDMRLSPLDGANPIIYYIKGIKHTLTSGVSVTGTGAYSGIHIMYMDSDEQLHEQLGYVSTVITDRALVTILYWNADYNEMVDFGPERHGIDMDGATHKWLHENMGAKYKGGMEIQGLANGVTTFTQYDTGIMDDEDISHTLPVQTVAPYWYLDNVTWRTTIADNKLGYVGVGTGVSYNLNTAGVYSLEEVTGNDCVIMFSLGTHNAPNKYVRIIGQNLYTSARLARAAIADEVNNLKLNGLPTPEFIFVNAYIIGSGGELKLDDEGNTHLDLRTSSISGLGVSSTATVHANTTNREALNSHPATAITYDPTESGMDATTVQTAIDEAATLGGGGDSSLYASLNADGIKITDWDSTNLLNGATFIEETTNPLAGDTSYRFNNAIGAAGDYAEYTIAVPIRSQRTPTHKLKFVYGYNGTKGNTIVQLYDGVAWRAIEFDPTKYSYTTSYNGGATEIKIRIKSEVEEVSAFIVDDIEFSDKFGEYGSETVSEGIAYTGFLSRDPSNYLRFFGDPLSDDSDLVLSSDNTGTATIITAKQKCNAVVGAGAQDSSATAQVQIHVFDKDNVQYPITPMQYPLSYLSVTIPLNLVKGDYIKIFETGATVANNSKTYFSVTATAQSQTVQFEDSYKQGHIVSSFKLEGNDSRTITGSTEDVYFIGSGDGWTSVGDTHFYTVKDVDTIINITLGIGLTTTTYVKYYVYKNDVFYKSIGNNDAGSSGSGTGFFQSEKGEFASGDVLSIRLSDTKILSNLATNHYLNITESYLPPAEQASPTRLLSVKQSLENDFDVDATSVGVLSNFNGASDWCSFVNYASGDYAYDVDTTKFTEFPKIWAISNFGDANIGITYGTFPRFTIKSRKTNDGTPYASGHSIFAKKSQADRSDRITHVLNGDDVVKANHKTTEFDTGETWIDGRKIYGRSFDLEVSVPDGSLTTLATVDTGLIPLELKGMMYLVSQAQWTPLIGAELAGGTTELVWYNPSTGVIAIQIANDTSNAQMLIFKYVK